MLKVKWVGSYKASHLQTGGQHCLSHKDLSFSHVLTSLIPCYRPLPQNTYQDSLYFVLHRLAVKRRKTEVGHKILPILCLTARERKATDVPGRCWQVIQTCHPGESLPRSEAPAWGEAVHLQRRWLLQGSIPRSETGSGGGGEYLRNGTSEPLKEGAA